MDAGVFAPSVGDAYLVSVELEVPLLLPELPPSASPAPFVPEPDPVETTMVTVLPAFALPVGDWLITLP